MQYTSCPHCKSEIPVASAICPTCHARVNAESSEPATRQHVARRNQKRCAICSKDITFLPRAHQADGSLVCQACAELPAIDLEADDVSVAAIPIETFPNRITRSEAKSRVSTPGQTKGKRTRALSPTRWAFVGVGSAVLIIAAAAWLIFTPTWEEANRDKINGMLSEAQALLARHQPKESYAKFNELFSFIGTHPVKDRYLREDMETARTQQQTAYSLAKPIIDAEAVATRLRIAREQQAEQARQAQIRVQHAEAERQKQIAAAEFRLKQAEERQRQQRQQREALARVTFLQSAEYRSLQARANEVYSDLKIGLIGEDSAYRGISRRARASRDLLAIAVQVKARLSGMNLNNKVADSLRASDVDLIGEDSAIRSTYKCDEATFELLGVWCEVFSKQEAKARQVFLDEKLRLLREMAGDNSAPRAISAYTEGCMNVLKEIASLEGFGTAANGVITQISLRNVSEDSAWRASMRNTQGTMELALILLNRDSDPEVKKLRAEITSSAVTDDSALRAQDLYRQGFIEAMRMMIAQN